MQTRPDEITRQAAPTVVGLGELTWDILPGGKQLGGAPSNFAYVAHLLGGEGVVASRVGADELGREAVLRLRGLGISTEYVQTDDTHPTGTVSVEVDAAGEPHFTVNENSAWDYLEWTPRWEELAGRAGVVCFGTLGQREPRARETILRFLRATRPGALRVFDVNLRHSFFTVEMLADSLRLASLVKFNEEELATAARMLRIDERDEIRLGRRLMESFGIGLVAVTRGARGSLLVTRDECDRHEGFRVEVADTIGAGDAFTAALALFRLRRAPLRLANEAANRVGAWVATQTGATPAPSPRILESVLGLLNERDEGRRVRDEQQD